MRFRGSETNNLTSTTVNFGIPALMSGVPIEYTDQDNITLPAQLPPRFGQDVPISSAVVTRQPYISWEQNLSIDTNWENLLSRIGR
jgi:hypothetical protein